MNINKIKMQTLYNIILGVFIGILLINIIRSFNLILNTNRIEFSIQNLMTEFQLVLLSCIITPFLEEIQFRFWLKKPNQISFLYVYSLILIVLVVLSILNKIFNINLLPFFETFLNFDTKIPETNFIAPHWSARYRIYFIGLIITMIIYMVLKLTKFNINWIPRLIDKFLWLIVTISSVLFAFYHDSVLLRLNDISILFWISILIGFGIIFSILRIRIGYLSAVVLHMIWNFNSFFITTLRVLNNNNILIALILFIIVSLLLYFLYRVMKNKNFDLPK
jgi:hypothetical protein